MIQSQFLDPLYRSDAGVYKKQELDFILPPELEAHMPPEARGLARDEVRLMVSYRSDDRVVHTRFRQIGDFLQAGDLLVINTSGTMKAALTARCENGMPVELHLSTHLPADLWLVEVRTQGEKGTRPFYGIKMGETLQLAEGASATLHVPYRHQENAQGRNRLWIATLHLPYMLQEYLARNGFPIRYSYVPQEWPIDYYQTVYVSEMGSAEMPSAGRAFTTELITSLISHGVQVAPLLLHTGVASLEDHEPPYEEYYRVTPETARIVNTTRAAGRRIVAVGTTVIRALETITDADGVTHAGEGWTSVVITPERGIRAVNGLLTGLHEPQATHLFMLEALASVEHLRKTYQEAIEKGYLWHEFGDLHLLLP
ncbi:MAG TPA: S-adenosylmethionine:tRNA ribosyltransferase-isomerase [Ktedonobacteraceae bacterium]|nr:S-adenosylmethionine:tRNA ribosyltransferase-isomerase [Ktedonobacteraceae bacterium]